MSVGGCRFGIFSCRSGRAHTEAPGAQVYELVPLNILKPDYWGILHSLDVFNKKPESIRDFLWQLIFRLVARAIAALWF